MVGLGAQEILVLGVVAIFLIGVPVAVVFVVLFLVRRDRGSRVAELEAENQHLRERREEK